MKFGIDRLLSEPDLRALAGKSGRACRASRLGDRRLVHSLDALIATGGPEHLAAFGPQHGLKGDKQDNMVETRTTRSGL
jgi:uncharacterized protein YbbC (DUF1343 family)